MQEHDAQPENDLSDFERTLAGLRPDRAGLSADAMLYAAGLAEGRRGRSTWTAACGALAAISFGLGAWGFSERGERQAMASRMERPAATPTVAPFPFEDQAPTPPPANGLFALRRTLEQDPERWLAMSDLGDSSPTAPPSPSPPIMNAGRKDGAFAQ